MKYLVPFAVVADKLGCGNGADKVAISRERLIEVIRLYLIGVPVQEAWYREIYPDVDEAIAGGQFTSARHHFIDSGYFEGRLPFPVDVDEEWYQSAYPDVAEGIESGEIKAGKLHFLRFGYAEGRLPSKFD